MAKKVLLLGHTGKMGIALEEVLSTGYYKVKGNNLVLFAGDYEVVGKNSKDFDAADFNEVRAMIKEVKPDIVVNTVAFLGIDSCENDPVNALRLNTIYPKLLAELSNENNFLLMHFSTDAVFNNIRDKFGKESYVESDSPKPLNMYGFTKYGGDCFIQSIAKEHYIIRLSVLFGKSIRKDQFVEKMFQKIEAGNKTIGVSNDIISSPSYSLDIANESKRILENRLPYGVYHVVNEGKVTLFELIQEIVQNLKLDVKVETASYKDFPYVGIKNTNTPLTSEKLSPLRSWKEAVKDYTDNLRGYKNGRYV